MKLACDQYYIDSERNPTGGIVGKTPNNERRYVNMAVTGIGTYASYTNSYGNTQNAGNKTGRTYKNAHEYKNYLTQKYDCLRSRDYSVNINSSLLSKAMGDEKDKTMVGVQFIANTKNNRTVKSLCGSKRSKDTEL